MRTIAKLTEKQKRFVDEYLIDLNATQAAIRAGYSEKSASRIAVELLNKTQVSDALQKAIGERSQRTEITQDRVVDELGKVAFAEAADYTDAELKYSNKLKALELLGKHLGIFDGKSGQDNGRENNLLEAIKGSGEVDVNDIPEAE